MTIRDSVRPALFASFLGVIATVLAVQALWLTYAVQDFFIRVPAAEEAFARAGIEGMAFKLAIAVGVLSMLFLFAAVMAVVRRGWVLRFMQAVCIGGYMVTIYAAKCASRAVEAYAGTGIPFQDVSGARTRVVYFLMQASVFKWILLALAGFALVHLVTTRRSAINLYTGVEGDEPAFGDRLVEGLRSGGKNPEYQKCWLMSVGTHAVAILLIPLFLQAGGCATKRVEPPPKTEGGPDRVTIKVIRPHAKTPKVIDNPTSPIVFPKVLDLTLTRIHEDVDIETQMIYEADPRRLLGELSGNGGKKQGVGWPGGTGKGKLAFVRLSYGGHGWDDGMDGKQPTYNLLRRLKKAFPSVNVDYTEKVESIRGLAQYVKGRAPPLVYMTGDGRIDISEPEVRILRKYLQDGGMLFADCGSPGFHQAFCVMVARLMPGDALLALSDDDKIFSEPFLFSNGAPPLWHHGGEKAMGVRYKGRICVFYHPGDLNDAWKTGNSGATEDKAELAFQIGMNVLYYAHSQYAQIAAKHRK